MQTDKAKKMATRSRSPLRVMLVDDHAMLLEAMCRQFESDPAFRVVAAASNLTAAREAMHAFSPDVVLLDIQIGCESGLDLIGDLLRICPEARVVIMSMFEQEVYRCRAFELGADAYVTKDACYRDLRELLLNVSLPDTGAQRRHIWCRTEMISARLGLTARELQVVHMLAAGCQVKEVANELAISISSVSTYLKRAMMKSGAATRAELFQYAGALGSQTPGRVDKKQA
jgi:two-component system, NarL family, invasion response regulator UvrY